MCYFGGHSDGFIAGSVYRKPPSFQGILGKLRRKPLTLIFTNLLWQ